MPIAMNLLTEIPAALPEELVQTLLSAGTLRIERIVSAGHSTPAGEWYDQSQAEFVVLVAGAAKLRFEDGEIEMSEGSYVNIPAHRRHRVEWTDPRQPTIWLAVHYGD
jgi:cupin 2 domain-containing protein